jgi:aryl-alcohol dehydrogenase-like predicted oxidoreductase
MKHRYLGNTGLLVSRICLGTMTFGQKEWGCDEDMAKQITRAFLEAGGNFIDTADIYSNGVSEEMLRECLRGVPRDDLVIGTKCFFRMGSSPNAKGLSRKHILSACDASLMRLGTDYVDLYQVHGPDPKTPIEETLRALDDLVRQGKVRYIGCSNLYAWQIARANAAAERINTNKFVSGQYLYNLVARDIEREILPALEAEGMGLICWSPLGSGMLTGKYRKADTPEPGSRIQLASIHELPRYWHERGFAIIEELNRVSAETGVPQARLALSWLLHDGRVSAVILGSRNKTQLVESLPVADWDMEESVWERLNTASQIDYGYPRQWMDLAVPATFSDHEKP